jgi:hypothetical protein
VLLAIESENIYIKKGEQLGAEGNARFSQIQKYAPN